jgi:hypothetical protein
MVLLSGLILVGAGIGAYLVNVPVLWIAALEAIAVVGIGAQITRPRQPDQLQSGHDRSPGKPE